jgi:sugar/nucleoside kinase (ribokinase family)
MRDQRIDVVGIGNAIVDVISRCDESFLISRELPKGHMRLIDTAEVEALYAAMGPAIETSGGSAANTMAGVASFGGSCAFIGRVANDELGRIFGHDIRAQGVAFTSRPADGGEPTGRCLIFVTPDGERTMNTYLGAAPHLARADLDAKLLGSAKIVYLEGYLFDRDAAKAAFHDAAAMAAQGGAKVALSLSDAFCVGRHRAEFLTLIRDRVDIVFANESELLTLYETHYFESGAAAVRKDATLAVITRSAKGSVILAGDRTIEVAVEPVNKVVDATGAGDLYAAGFLYGYASERPLAECGRLASIAAAEVIGHVGARPQVPLAELAKARGLSI